VGRALIAANGRVLADEILATPPANPVTRFSGLPYLVPLLSAGPPVAHVVVVADKVHATFSGVDRDGNAVHDEPVRGQDHQVHHVAGGGFSHGSMENRAEEIVRQNGRLIAEATTRLAERTGAELLVVVGEVQARSLLTEALSATGRRHVVEVDLDASTAEADPGQLSSAVDRVLARYRAEQDLAAVDRLWSGTAHGTAEQGLDAVTEALRIGQVETLLIGEHQLTDRRVFLGADWSQVATDRADLADAADGLTEESADEALPAAAIATAAEVLVLANGQTGDKPIQDGVAALLRFAR
jgi:peptide subunit release factor 1 (eRF1)